MASEFEEKLRKELGEERFKQLLEKRKNDIPEQYTQSKITDKKELEHLEQLWQKSIADFEKRRKEIEQLWEAVEQKFRK